MAPLIDVIVLHKVRSYFLYQCQNWTGDQKAFA